FGLLLEVVEESTGVSDNEGMSLEIDDALTLATYRNDYKFVPDLVFEFIGASPLRRELDFTNPRLLIQAADRRDVFVLDQWSATALKALLEPEQAKRRQDPTTTSAPLNPLS